MSTALEKRSAAGRAAFVLALLLATGCGRTVAPGPRNLVLLIGDGMGLAHVTTARLALAGPDGTLAMDGMPVTGLVRTSPTDAVVTDSAAAATALATGTRTRNGRIGSDPDGRPLTTLLEAAAGAGRATGLVVTSTITHATPASFAAHAEDRADEGSIAVQLVGSGVDVLVGGGRAWFQPGSTPGSRRTDDRDLLAAAAAAGYTVVATEAELAAATGPRILGLLAPEGIRTGAADAPALPSLTRAVLDRLAAAPRGFVLMVEGSQIDWAGHANDLPALVDRMREFDATVAVALAFARERGDTLVVVTADHETGGLAVTGGAPPAVAPAPAAWSTHSHTAQDVPLYAEGPGAARFTGSVDNAEVGRRLAGALGLGVGDVISDP